MHSLRRYFHIYQQIFITRVQMLFAFRLNTFVHFLYGPAYFIVLFVVQQLAYTKAPELGGWTRDQATLVLSVCFVLYTLTFILYISSLRQFLWDGIRHGVVDQYLTKPASPLFFIAWSKPDIAQIPMFVLTVALFLRQVWLLGDTVTVSGMLFAVLAAALGVWLHYLAITTYTSLGFVMTKAEQVLELFDKVSDSGQYPTNIFPGSLQFLLVAVVPVAFLGYVPAQFLLEYRPWHWVLLECLLILSFVVIHKFAWKYAIRQYTSASS